MTTYETESDPIQSQPGGYSYVFSHCDRSHGDRAVECADHGWSKSDGFCQHVFAGSPSHRLAFSRSRGSAGDRARTERGPHGLPGMAKSQAPPQPDHGICVPGTLSVDHADLHSGCCIIRFLYFVQQL